MPNYVKSLKCLVFFLKFSNFQEKDTIKSKKLGYFLNNMEV